MPKIFLHYPEDTFDLESLAALAEELTTIGLACEKLPNTPFVRSTVWIYMRAYGSGTVFVGGSKSSTKVISAEVNVLEGGLEDSAKEMLIEQFTATLSKHAGLGAERPPIYVLIRETKPSNWGFFGRRLTLDALRSPSDDSVPL